MRWEVLDKQKTKNEKEIVEALLSNRNIKTENDKKEFFEPINPLNIPLKSLNVKNPEVEKAIKRIKSAKVNKESVIIYGDYDADGITATAIMWETLHELGLEVLPHIPDRFEEGYGINAESVDALKLKIPDLKLIITVDNGIVGYDGIKKAKELGIDVIVIDHHVEGKKKNLAFSIIHSTLVSGSALTWFFSCELIENWKIENSLEIGNWKLEIASSLELAAIGTVADQLPLIGINRSIVKYGLEALNKTKRPGLRAILESSKVENVGTYEINYIIAPRINAMGRLANGLDSLRLLCTTSLEKAKTLSNLLNKTNLDRQKMVEQVLLHALKISKGNKDKVIVLSHKTYHEGVIGLAAGKLVEEFYRPAIVLSTKGKISKASARSISGFNIIEAIRSVNLHLEGGGHPMAAGFSIETDKIEVFTKEINKYADKLLTDELLERKLKIDCEVNFDQLTYKLLEELQKFEPIGLGNFAPTFAARNVKIVEAKPVGREKKHLKLTLSQDGTFFDAIWFSPPTEFLSNQLADKSADVAFSLEDNTWNGYKNLQLKIKDLKVV
jgi:single-stranded-DNA-specific exonuclease